MSSYTGASALLALLTRPQIACPWCGGRGGFEPDPQDDPPERTGCSRCQSTAKVWPAERARKAARNAFRRLVRAHGGRLGPAAAALGVSKEALIAGAAAIGLRLRGKPGRPRLGGDGVRDGRA